MIRRFGMPRLPALDIRADQSFDVIAERRACSQKRLKLLAARASRAPALIGDASDLIEIPADRP
jgi:hypothetical protein